MSEHNECGWARAISVPLVPFYHLQALQKGRMKRKEVQERKEKALRKKAADARKAEEAERAEQERAAVKMQAINRGRNARKKRS